MGELFDLHKILLHITKGSTDLPAWSTNSNYSILLHMEILFKEPILWGYQKNILFLVN